MNDLESDLRRVLRPGPVPPGLAARIIDRAGATGPIGKSGRPPHSRRWLGAAAVVILAAGLIAGREIVRYREGEQAKEELMMGLRIAGTSLRQIQERITALDFERPESTE